MATLTELVEGNTGLALKEARRWIGRGLDWDDLLAAAVQGLLVAANKFDEGRNCKFSTYATWWCRQHCQRAVANNRSAIRAPVYVQVSLAQKLRSGAGLTPAEKDARAARLVRSLTGMPPIRCMQRSAEEAAVAKEEAELLRLALESLPERSRTVIRRYYLERERAPRIAKALGVSRSTVENIRNDALRRLHKELSS